MCIRDRDDITVPRMMIEHKLPVVLSVNEIDRLLDATDEDVYKRQPLDGF